MINGSEGQRRLEIAGLEHREEEDDQQLSNRATLYHYSRTQGESASKPAGLRRAFCLGPSEEHSDTQGRPQIAGLGCREEKEDQQPLNRAPFHRSTRAKGKSSSKQVGMGRTFCLGPIEEHREEQRRLQVADLGCSVDQQHSNRAPLHRSTRTQDESGCKPVGMWRPQVVEVGAGSRSRSRQEPQIAEAGAGSRSRSGKEVQRPRLKTTILRSDESSSVHEESRSGSLELAADERNQIQEAGNPQIWIPPQKGAYKVNIDGS